MTWWAKYNHHFNQPNGISIARGFIGLGLPFLFLSPDRNFHIAGGIVFTIGAISDYFDGWLARKQGLVTNLGKILDPTTDKILILGTLASFSCMGLFSPWWLVPIFAREIIVTFCRLGWLLQGKAAAAEKLGKIKLVVQVLLVASPFAEIMTLDFPSILQHYLFFHQCTFVLLILTNLLTLVSGYTFMRTNWALFKDPKFAKFTSACGVGLLPGPGGTWGSLLTLPLIPLVAWNQGLYWGVFLFILWAGHRAVGRLDLSREKDPQFVVIDEVLGVFLTFAFVPINFTTIIAGFLLFRLFDIVKPFPCRQLEKIPGFWGITLDDLGAGVYACLILHFFVI